MKQSETRLNQYLSNSRSDICSIIHNSKMDYSQLKNLEQQHSIIGKELVNLHLKGRIAGGRVQEGIEKVYSTFIYNHGLNDEDIRVFFKSLSKRIDEGTNVKMESKDINEVESILELYSELGEKLSNINY